jgi:hypothetical protein
MSAGRCLILLTRRGGCSTRNRPVKSMEFQGFNEHSNVRLPGKVSRISNATTRCIIYATDLH